RVDDRRRLVGADRAGKSGVGYGLMGPTAIESIVRNPAQVQFVPVSLTTSEVPHGHGKGGRYVGANGAIVGYPIVQWIAKRADVGEPMGRRADHQRDQADRLAGRLDDQHFELLGFAKVAPVDFEPVVSLKKTGLRSFLQQSAPPQAIVLQVVE